MFKRVAIYCVCFLFSSSAVLAAELSSFSVGGIKVRVSDEGGGSYKLSLEHGASLQPNAFLLDNPARLVIDLPKGVGQGGAPKHVINKGVFATLRVGAHPDKTRLVFDLIDAEGVAVSQAATPKGLEVLLAKKGVSALPAPTPAVKPPPPTTTQQVVPTLATTSAPTPVPTAAKPTSTPAKPTPTPLKPTPTPIPTATPQPRPSPQVVTPAPPPVATLALTTAGASSAATLGELEAIDRSSKGGARVLNAISFVAQPDASAVSLAMSESGNFTLTQVGPASYVLVLENTRLAGPHLSLPFFPPDTLEGFEAVRAAQQGNNVAVSVYTNGEGKLTAAFAEGQLWIKLTK
jgi:hypothetical protein